MVFVGRPKTLHQLWMRTQKFWMQNLCLMRQLDCWILTGITFQLWDDLQKIKMTEICHNPYKLVKYMQGLDEYRWICRKDKFTRCLKENSFFSGSYTNNIYVGNGVFPGHYALGTWCQQKHNRGLVQFLTGNLWVVPAENPQQLGGITE